MSLAESVECIVLQDVALDPLGGAASTRANQQHKLAIRHTTKKTFNQRGAQEAG